MTSLISFLSDFGTRDPWVPICRGVILAIAPDARLVDVTHDVPPFDVRAGALTLAAVLPELPVGVHLAVVDPGVGTERRGVALRTGRGDLLVGPDNGLLLPAAAALGGVSAAVELRDERYRRASGARTFHGRDVFAPAAAYLATGVPLASFGPGVVAADLVALDLPVAEVDGDALRTGVRTIDRYGNVALAGGPADLAAAVGPMTAGEPLLVQWAGADGTVREATAAWAATFGDAAPGDLLAYVDSLGQLALAVNLGTAADRLGLGPGTLVTLRRPAR